jgi:hypothetical protein
VVPVAGYRVVKGYLEYLLFGARDVKRAILLAGIKSAIGENAAFGCHDRPPFLVERSRYARLFTAVNRGGRSGIRRSAR